MGPKQKEINAIRAIAQDRGITYTQAKKLYTSTLGLEPKQDEGDIGKAASDILKTQEQVKRSRNLPSDLDPMSAAGRAAHWNASFGDGGASPFSRSAEERAAVEQKRLGTPGATGVANAVNALRMDQVAEATGTASPLTDSQRAEAKRLRAYGYAARFAAPPTTQGTVVDRPRPWQMGTPTGASRMPVAGGGIDLVGQAKDPRTGAWGGNNILASSRPVAAAGDGKTVLPGTYVIGQGGTTFAPPGGEAKAQLPQVFTPTVKKASTLPDELPKPPNNLMLAEFRAQHGSEFDPKSALDRSKMMLLKPQQKKKVEVAAL